ncbi:MAG TPA: DUF4139 domain-containing protein [Lacipirellulaceae bacterium]|nr:DUF4139 domain-containing protein [Lacipirellulaceae bacterium]
MKSNSRVVAAMIVGMIFHSYVRAENVDLSTVPKRDSVQLTIYNSEDITLVRETRIVTFKKSVNPLQFSWANTLIDPSSVELRFLSSVDKLDVADTTFPHDKPQMLYWNVRSEIEGEATIQITYFTSGITWSSDYVAIADKGETKLDLDGFVRVTNNSGEEYENAEIRLVVGTINLVEKIAQLANVPMDAAKQMAGENRDKFRREVLADSLSRVAIGGGQANIDAPVPAEKTIFKEGLSEYFIYSVEGTETIPNGWSKRMRSFEGKGVPVKVAYRYRPKEYGDQLVRLYVTANNKESELGTTPLPDGVVRLFRSNGRGGLSYLTQQSIKYVPIGDKIELNLGPDPNVVFELKKVRMARDKLWMQLHGKNKFQEVGVDTVETEQNSTVVGWDDVGIYQQEIRNYSDKPIDVEIRRSFEGDVVFRSRLTPTEFDYQTAQFATQVPAGAKKDLLYEVVQHQGRNAKQNHVALEGADVKLSR